MNEIAPLVISSNHPQIAEVETPEHMWRVLEEGYMLTCKDAGFAHYAELFADEADVQISSAPDPHGNVTLTVWHQNGDGVKAYTVNQRSRFPLSGFSWKLK